jgi:hypothetical protein
VLGPPAGDEQMPVDGFMAGRHRDAGWVTWAAASRLAAVASSCRCPGWVAVVGVGWGAGHASTIPRNGAVDLVPPRAAQDAGERCHLDVPGDQEPAEHALGNIPVSGI